MKCDVGDSLHIMLLIWILFSDINACKTLAPAPIKMASAVTTVFRINRIDVIAALIALPPLPNANHLVVDGRRNNH